MQTLSKGIKKPENGDRGSVFYPALAANAQQQNDHAHDGSDGAQIASKNVTRGSVVSAGSGYSASGDWFVKTITCPTGYSFDTHEIRVFLTSSGERLYPRLEKLTSTTFRVYMPYDAIAATYVFT